MSAAIADILDRAADLIEPEGAWIQILAATLRDGTPAYYDTAECFCLHGAINAAAYRQLGELDYIGPADTAFDFVAGFVDEPSVIDFNDAPERTQPEVVAKLREAAAKAREASS